MNKKKMDSDVQQHEKKQTNKANTVADCDCEYSVSKQQ